MRAFSLIFFAADWSILALIFLIVTVILLIILCTMVCCLCSAYDGWQKRRMQKSIEKQMAISIMKKAEIENEREQRRMERQAQLDGIRQKYGRFLKSLVTTLISLEEFSLLISFPEIPRCTNTKSRRATAFKKFH